MSKNIVLKFIEKINEADVAGMGGLMSDEHIFIDNIGNEMSGKEKMKEAWKSYYDLFPDYKIEVSEIFQNGGTFLLYGIASGSFQNRKEKDAHYSIPAAWKALVENDRIKLWQVFADTKVQFDIIQKYTGK